MMGSIATIRALVNVIDVVKEFARSMTFVFATCAIVTTRRIWIKVIYTIWIMIIASIQITILYVLFE